MQIDATVTEQPLQEGKFVILKDEPNAKMWYCAEIRKILADRIEVNCYTTVTPALLNYLDSSITLREESLEEAHFLRTWCLDRGKGLPTITLLPPTNHGKIKHLWWGRIPLDDASRHILVRGVGLSALGKLDWDTIKLAAKLEVPHHEGAGAAEDFKNREAVQRHVKRVSNRLKRKR